MICEINPSNSELIDLLAEEIEARRKVEVFYPLWDGGFADYGGTVEWRDGRYHYDWGGHGIGNSHSSVKTPDEMIERILSDNERFNRSGPFHMRTEKESEQGAAGNG